VPANGLPATWGNGGTVGPRSWHPTAYAGYPRDLDGNKICAYCFKGE
jgi:hypothetical protein